MLLSINFTLYCHGRVNHLGNDYIACIQPFFIVCFFCCNHFSEIPIVVFSDI